MGALSNWATTDGGRPVLFIPYKALIFTKVFERQTIVCMEASFPWKSLSVFSFETRNNTESFSNYRPLN